VKKIVLVGDSIRMGYQAYVRKELSGLSDVWAPEQNGGNSTNIQKHLNEWIISQAADVVHINCGLHDLKRDFGADETVIPLLQYQANLRDFLERTLQETQSTVVWATTTPVNEIWHHQRKGFDRLESDVVAYNDVSVEVAQEFGVLINDLFQVIVDAGRDNYLSPDGVHFTADGCDLLGKSVVDYIKPLLCQ